MAKNLIGRSALISIEQGNALDVSNKLSVEKNDSNFISFQEGKSEILEVDEKSMKKF